jgi:hypothetical protein
MRSNARTTAYRYPVGRGADARRQHYPDGQDTFLRDKARVNGARMCQVMFAIPPSVAKHDERQPWNGFPWLTLVLGSGCLDLPAEASYAPDKLAVAIESMVPLAVPLPAGAPDTEDLPAYVARFTRELLRSRSPEDYDLSEDAPPPDLDDLAVRLVAIAALLTRFFYLVRGSREVALSRWDDEIAAFPYREEEDERDRDIDLLDSPTQLAMLAGRTIRAARAELAAEVRKEDAEVSRAVDALLRGVFEKLRKGEYEDDPPRIVELGDLRLISEVAWYFLIRGSRIYPGWTDMLLRLMLREGSAAFRGHGRARPRDTSLRQLPQAVSDLLEEVTQRSFASALYDPSTERERLYAGVADVLWAQSEAREGLELEVGRSLPPASAFVTSFDIELDMAMWRTSEGRPFSVVLPVHVLRQEHSPEAAFCWLMAEVRPNQDGIDEVQLGRLRNELYDWRLITPDTPQEQLTRHPVIVHLNGCPMFATPQLVQTQNPTLLAQLAAVGIHDGAVVNHAVTVDEYLALRQSTAELFWTTDRTRDTKNRNSRALPPMLTLDTEIIPRYWMALGLPMDDAAVRNRFTSQITLGWVRHHAFQRPEDESSGLLGRDTEATPPAAPPQSGSSLLGADPEAEASSSSANGRSGTEPAPESPRADVYGVAVNTRMSADEVVLLNWLGLDVVHGASGDFTSELHHYAEHVREPERRPPFDEACDLHAGGAS